MERYLLVIHNEFSGKDNTPDKSQLNEKLLRLIRLGMLRRQEAVR